MTGLAGAYNSDGVDQGGQTVIITDYHGTLSGGYPQLGEEVSGAKSDLNVGLVKALIYAYLNGNEIAICSGNPSDPKENFAKVLLGDIDAVFAELDCVSAMDKKNIKSALQRQMDDPEADNGFISVWCKSTFTQRVKERSGSSFLYFDDESSALARAKLELGKFPNKIFDINDLDAEDYLANLTDSRASFMLAMDEFDQESARAIQKINGPDIGQP